MSKKLVITRIDSVLQLYACSGCLTEVDGGDNHCRQCGAEIAEHAYSLAELTEVSDLVLKDPEATDE